MNLANGVPDLQGVGFFLRGGISDQDTNPVEWTLSGGIGGRGGIPGRDDDTFGIAYYYTKVQQTRFTGIAGLDDDSEGIEAYYSIALSPAADLTFSAPAVEGVLPSTVVEDGFAVLLGVRLNLRF